MKALKDNCVMTKLDVDLFKENNDTLKSFFVNNRIIALFDIPEGCKSHFSDPFSYFRKSLLYNKFFSVVSVKGTESFSIYITSSLLNQGNMIKLVNDYYVYDGAVFIKTEKPAPLRPYMEGVFGFRKTQLGTASVAIEVCFPLVISAHDAHYHLVPDDKDPSLVKILTELPPRYPAEQYFENLKEIGRQIMPLSLQVEAPLSATVSKAVR